MRIALSILKWLTIVFLIFSISGVVVYKVINPPFTLLMFKRVIGQMVDGESIKLKHNWVSIDKISPNLVQAVVSSEDGNFTEHYGVDFDAIQKAMKYNQKGRRIKGGSTISQQTAKNVFLIDSRTYLRKGIELYYTLLMETVWSKERIMEMYLNMIEMGDGVYGAQAASQIYFKKPAKGISRGEAALIAASLPNPRTRNPARPSKYMSGRQYLILKAMNKIGKVELNK